MCGVENSYFNCPAVRELRVDLRYVWRGSVNIYQEEIILSERADNLSVRVDICFI